MRPIKGMTIFAGIALLAGTAIPASAAPVAWDVVPSPNPGTFSNQLFGTDALLDDDAWAVGVSSTSLLDKPDTLAMRWDGSTWTIVPTPNPNSSLQSNRLRDVTVIASDDAWAVGGITFGANSSPLLLHWDGTAWTMEDASGLPPSVANAVHAVADDDVWAMGMITQGGTGFATLAAHYDGSSWTPVNVPNAAFGGLEFQAIDGLATDDVWAVGFENPGNGIFAPLVAHWDGSAWTSANVEPLSGQTLHDVAMIATDDAWAVGRIPVTGIGDQPYAIHWDGSSWTQATLPVFGDGHATLEGVAARAADDVWAVGTNGDTDGIPRPLILHYDGDSWQEVAVAPSGGSHEWFHAAVCAPGGAVWGVGQYSNGSGTATLTARLAASNPADLDASGDVTVNDLLMLIASWGTCAGCPADLDGDGSVGTGDLLMLIASWG